MIGAALIACALAGPSAPRRETALGDLGARCDVAEAVLARLTAKRVRHRIGWRIETGGSDFQQPKIDPATFADSFVGKAKPSVALARVFASARTRGPADDCPAFRSQVRTLGGLVQSPIEVQAAIYATRTQGVLHRPCLHITMLSTPIVNQAQTEALAEVSGSCGFGLGGAGFVWYLRRDAGQWVPVGGSDDWIS